MGWREADEDDDDSDELDPEDPDDSDMDEHDEQELVPCPECGKAIGEDAARCHHCGSDVLRNAVASRTPTWVYVAAIVLLAAVVFIALNGGF